MPEPLTAEQHAQAIKDACAALNETIAAAETADLGLIIRVVTGAATVNTVTRQYAIVNISKPL